MMNISTRIAARRRKSLGRAEAVRGMLGEMTAFEPAKVGPIEVLIYTSARECLLELPLGSTAPQSRLIRG